MLEMKLNHSFGICTISEDGRLESNLTDGCRRPPIAYTLATALSRTA
jgi:hypothetical protein